MELFGTDGIRGVANKYPIDCNTLMSIGKAISFFFRSTSGVNKILIGWDPRNSSHMIASAIASGISSLGLNVVIAGIMPTPAIALLTARENYCAGIVVSGSHNQFCDNGIKIFDSNGLKLDNTAESELERLIINFNKKKDNYKVKYLGQLSCYKDPIKKYNSFLKDSCLNFHSIKGIKIVLDCSNGSTSICAPMIFTELGANVTSIFCSPNGININSNCGSEYPEILAKKVLDNNADLGLAFDGDGDRLTAVSELGQVLNGDQLLAIFAYDFKKNNYLKNNIVVSTVISNLGLTNFFEKIGIEHVRTHVGDKNVITKMFETNAVLGGESSGHIIFENYKKIGDGIFTGLQLIEIMKKSSSSLSELSRKIKMFPQCVANLEVTSKPNLQDIPAIWDAIKRVENELINKGRILVRYSGTESKCRIVVEGNETKKIKKYCDYITKIITKHIGT